METTGVKKEKTERVEQVRAPANQIRREARGYSGETVKVAASA